MHAVRALLIYLAATFIAAGCLAPWLFAAAHWLANQAVSLRPLAEIPFQRIVNRALLACALIGLWPFLRTMGSPSWKDLGLTLKPGAFKSLVVGATVGFASLALAAAATILSQARQLNIQREPIEMAKHLFNASLAAVGAGVIEEVIFRGVLFGALRRHCSTLWALAISSVLYALAHFFQSSPPPREVSWFTGFWALSQMLHGIIEWKALMPGFLNLTLAGFLLGSAFHRTGALYFSIGLHGGWIFWLKTWGFFSLSHPQSNLWFWGTSKLIDGWVAFPLLALAGLLVWRATDPPHRSYVHGH